MRNTCDKVADCPDGDDEQVCFQNIPECPTECDCSI